MKLAKEQLTSTDRSLSEIASSIGIENYTYFCRLFKRTAGVSPTAYRKLNKKSPVSQPQKHKNNARVWAK